MNETLLNSAYNYNGYIFVKVEYTEPTVAFTLNLNGLILKQHELKSIKQIIICNTIEKLIINDATKFDITATIRTISYVKYNTPTEAIVKGTVSQIISEENSGLSVDTKSILFVLTTTQTINIENIKTTQINTNNYRVNYGSTQNNVCTVKSEENDVVVFEEFDCTTTYANNENTYQNVVLEISSEFSTENTDLVFNENQINRFSLFTIPKHVISLSNVQIKQLSISSLSSFTLINSKLNTIEFSKINSITITNCEITSMTISETTQISTSKVSINSLIENYDKDTSSKYEIKSTTITSFKPQATSSVKLENSNITTMEIDSLLKQCIVSGTGSLNLKYSNVKEDDVLFIYNGQIQQFTLKVNDKESQHSQIQILIQILQIMFLHCLMSVLHKTTSTQVLLTTPFSSPF